MSQVWISLGGNQTETLSAFRQARQSLERLCDSPRVSAIYLTEPQLDLHQPVFWNAVLTGIWSGSAFSLLERLQMLEISGGRVRDPARPKGPRTLDLDLLFVDQLILESRRLVLPHPGVVSRRFVLDPILSLDPYFIHPSSGKPLASFCEAVQDQGVEVSTERW